MVKMETKCFDLISSFSVGLYLDWRCPSRYLHQLIEVLSRASSLKIRELFRTLWRRRSGSGQFFWCRGAAAVRWRWKVHRHGHLWFRQLILIYLYVLASSISHSLMSDIPISSMMVTRWCIEAIVDTSCFASSITFYWGTLMDLRYYHSDLNMFTIISERMNSKIYVSVLIFFPLHRFVLLFDFLIF